MAEAEREDSTWTKAEKTFTGHVYSKSSSSLSWNIRRVADGSDQQEK